MYFQDSRFIGSGFVALLWGFKFVDYAYEAIRLEVWV